MNRSILALAGLAAAASVASAGSEIHSFSRPMGLTSWTDAFAVQQFDTQGGTRVLDSIEVFLEGTVLGDAAAESLDAEPSTITLNLTATISLSLGATLLAQVIPLANEIFDASAFDDVIDFGGTSGVTYENLTDTQSTTSLITDPLEFAPWIGLGTVSVDGAASGFSSGSGAGNLLTQFGTSAELNGSVTYNFHIIPAPGAAALLAIGVLAGRRRR